MTQVLPPIELNDYDVLGIGGLRRARVLADPRPRILKTHLDLIPPGGREIYDHILKHSVQILKPQQVVQERSVGKVSEILFHLLKTNLEVQFPKLIAQLPDYEAWLRKYLEEFPWHGPLLADHFRYWPQFLKTHLPDPGLYRISQKEWLWSYVSFADFGAAKPEPGLVVANPSLQFLQTENALSAIYFDELRTTVVEEPLDIMQAAILDALADDRKYTLDQLREQLRIGDAAYNFLPAEIEKTIQKMLEQGTISVGA